MAFVSSGSGDPWTLERMLHGEPDEHVGTAGTEHVPRAALALAGGKMEKPRQPGWLRGRSDSSGWPEKASVAVAISFDVDNETAAFCLKETSPGRISQSHYGARVGLPKILELLTAFNVRASFFIPAVSVQLDPQGVESIQAEGHETGAHGWIHERCSELSEQEESDLAGRSLEVLRRYTGTAPRGMRTPWWDLSAHTLPIAQRLGLMYDSSMMADDEPYELLNHGKHTGMMEIPVAWIRDDAPYFPDNPADRQAMAPRQVLQIWKDKFDGALAAGGLFQLTLHPHVIGHRSRVLILRELLAYITGCAHEGVWYATHEEVARHTGSRIDMRARDVQKLQP
ncbi:polysaccharide deacetylase family protein [Streptomyces pinistramenti]|uniref:polysaccharide deacetylase family protein n=1 Tax=Streptomyces pinistramenti TaxID=2884812 RepID=UPI001D07CF67|nr:polysaccharide deacetylase [Streptomyces pinistramenti]MCB5912190.1 polysaccharide deacetylase [Streptomyces pinistramenti]